MAIGGGRKMLIRSQDKKMLFDITGSNIGIAKNNTIYGWNSFSDVDIPTFLGRYPTEERAIEVLDEICQNYEDIKFMERRSGHVFQMPEE